MFDLKKRVIAGFLGLFLTFAVAACGDDDDNNSPTTTSPGGEPTTTEGVGS